MHLRLYTFIALLSVTATSKFFAQPSSSIPDKLRAYLQRAEAKGYAGSVLVAHKGTLVFAQGFGMADRESRRPQTAETVFSVGSISKQFTGAAILKLWEQGKIRLEDPLSRYFPDAPADKAGITIHQMLTHTAGFPDAIGEDYELADAAAFAKQAFAAPLESPPGTAYRYSNVGYSFLGIIIEKTSGKGYEQFLHENLWKPAGMTQTGYLLPKHTKEALAIGYRDGERWGSALDHPWLADGPGWHLRANGGVLSTVGDMYLWYKALKNNTVLSKAATEKLFKPHTAEGPSLQSFYGYGWVVQDLEGQRIIWHNGGNGVYNAFMGFLPAEDFCVVVSSNSNDKISDPIARQIQKIALQGSDLLSDDFIKTYTGRYRLPSGSTFEAGIDETNSLTVFCDQAEPIRLLATDGTETPTETENVGGRSVLMLEGVKNGDFSLLAKYRGVSLETAQQRIRPFWEDMQAERGRIKSVELLAVAARRKMGLMLSFMKVNFEKSPLCFMYVWRGETIEDVQQMERLDKVFECVDGKNTFHAANNNRSIVAETDGKGQSLLRIRHPSGDILAVRIGDAASKPAPAATPTRIVQSEEGEPPYRNNPVTDAIFKAIVEKGAAHFTQNSRQILQDAGFDFDNDMQLLGVGERLEEMGKWDEGIALFETYTRLFPNIVVAWNRLGKCRAAKGDMAGARAAWEQSVRLRPNGNPAAEWLKNK